MRLAVFLPVAFLAGADGLPLLIPYVLFMAIVSVGSVILKRREQYVRIPVGNPYAIANDLELEPAAL